MAVLRKRQGVQLHERPFGPTVWNAICARPHSPDSTKMFKTPVFHGQMSFHACQIAHIITFLKM